MGNNASNKPPKPAVGTKGLLTFFKMLADVVFPSNDDYSASLWGQWAGRIEKGQMDDETGEFVVNELVSPEHLTNNMYATLVVSLWSMLESFLNIVLGCNKAHGNQTKAPPHKIKDIKDAIKKAFNVDIENCQEYKAVDAIRVLSNSYKHDNGRYKPETENPYTKIDQSLVERWKIPDASKEIIYSDLPMHEIVGACNIFCHDLCDKISAALYKIEETDHRYGE